MTANFAFLQHRSSPLNISEWELKLVRRLVKNVLKKVLGGLRSWPKVCSLRVCKGSLFWTMYWFSHIVIFFQKNYRTVVDARTDVSCWPGYVNTPFFMSSLARVTRLGDFSPNGRLFVLGIFWKMTNIPQFGATFLQSIDYVFILAWKMGLGDFFTNSSGHPVTSLVSALQQTSKTRQVHEFDC
jgi:hypothetical protein